MANVILDVCAPLLTLGVAGCFRYLGRILHKLESLERRDFTQDLHLLDLYDRLDDRRPHRRTTAS